MNLSTSRLNAYGAQLTTLLGTASLLTMAGVIANQDRAYAGEATAEEIPENVLITGSLIRGTVAVGVPVVNLSPMDFAQTGSLTTADLFRNVASANVDTGETGISSGARVERGAKVNIRGLDTGTAVRSLMMVDGMRFPPQSNGLCAIDPSVIPSISLDHIDILVDGASATYGSDAISGVINLVLRRNYDGAMTQFRYTDRVGGGARYQIGQLWGRTWDGGQITLSYEWYDESPTKGNTISNFGVDHSPWGYDNRTPLSSSTPATIATSGNLNIDNPAAPGSTISNSLGTACKYNTGTNPITKSVCYAVPVGTGANFTLGTLGPTAPFSGSTLNWATFSQDTNFAGPLNATAGTRNVFNPYSEVWFDAAEQRNGGALTIDQRLTKDISFYGEAFYSNRRAQFLVPNNQGPATSNGLAQIAVPTWNPYYPTGGAPSGLRVNYDLNKEMPALVSAYELAARYQMGLNIALPAGWESQIFYSETYDSSFNHASNVANKSAVSAALGWTISPSNCAPDVSGQLKDATGKQCITSGTPTSSQVLYVPAGVAPTGSAPAFGTFTKPASVPYLNLFCDPTTYMCNSPTTLNYIQGYRSLNEKFWINEKGVKADGPLFDLPGGTVKAAIGANLTSSRFNYVSQDNTAGSAHDLTINPVTDPEGRFVWATFAQVNIPIFGDNNAIFGMRKFEIEASWRHDQYSDVGGTSNPKIAFNWTPFDDLTIKGAWGSNFRAPVFGEISPVANAAINPWNMDSTIGPVNGINACGGVGQKLPGVTSGAGKLQVEALAFNNAMAAALVPGYSAKTGCLASLNLPQPTSDYSQPLPAITDPSYPFVAAASPISGFANISNLLTPSGITTLGGPGVSYGIRQFTQQGLTLTPEKAANWGIGFDYTPTNILRGLDIQATYWIVKLTNQLSAFGNPNDSRFQDPTIPFAFPSPEDIGCPALPNSAAPGIPIPANLVPSACAQWMAAVDSIISNPRGQVAPSGRTLVYWINDGGTFNIGWQKIDGIDWNWSYDWDMGNIGAFNVGASGTWYLHNIQVKDSTPGSPGNVQIDGFHNVTGSNNALSNGVPTLPYLHYRGRLGWSNGPWNVTGFMDYFSHYYHTQSAPPNVNGSFCTNSSFGAPVGGTFPCFNDHYSNLLPPYYSFDLALGYDTGDAPANNYLKNIGVQLIIQDILDKHTDYQYRTASQGGQPCTCDLLRPMYGRQVSVIITKTW